MFGNKKPEIFVEYCPPSQPFEATAKTIKKICEALRGLGTLRIEVKHWNATR